MARLASIIVCLTAGAAFAAASCLAQDTTTYTYDELGRVSTVTNPSGAKSGYSYDKADNRTRAQTALNGVLTSNNRAPVCVNHTYSFSIPPSAPPQPASFPASFFTYSDHCTDADGDTLTLISPAAPVNFTIAAGETKSYVYTVSDGHGGTSTANQYFTRP